MALLTLPYSSAEFFLYVKKKRYKEKLTQIKKDMQQFLKNTLLIAGNVVVFGSWAVFLTAFTFVAISAEDPQNRAPWNYFKRRTNEIFYESTKLKEVQSLKTNYWYKRHYHEICSRSNYEFRYALKDRSPEITEYLQAEYNRVMAIYGIHENWSGSGGGGTGNPQITWWGSDKKSKL